MASKSIFDELLGSLGGAGRSPGATQAGGGGLGDLLNQISGALGGAGGGTARGGSGGGLGEILGQLQNSFGGASGGRSSGNGSMDGLGDRVGQMMGDQKSFAKGAAAGGLMGALLGGKGTAKAAGAAVIGTLAWRAYQNWKAAQAAEHTGGQSRQSPAALPDESFLPAGAAAEQLSDKLARAMIAAAKADGQVTSRERRQILDALQQQGVGSEAQHIMEEELDAPLDVARIAALAATPEEAVQIYTASLLAVDPEAPEEAAYLADLASRLGLAPDLVAHLNATTGA